MNAQRIMVGLIAGAVLAGSALALTTPVMAQNHPAPSLVQLAPTNPNPGLGDDVYLYHPILQSVPQTPPLVTLIRFRMEAYTNYTPQAFHMQVHLMWWRSARQLHRPRGRWVEIHPSARYGISQLPAVGQHAYLVPPAEWACHTGRLYVRIHVWGITHSGHPEATNLYFPWKGFNRKHLRRGNVHRPPSLHQAWRTSCQGNDTLIG